MTFDLRPELVIDGAEGQLAEGGVNAHANCVPAAHTVALMAYGLPDIPPQTITDAIFPGGNAPQGMPFALVVDWIARNVPGAPPMEVLAPSAPLTALADWGAAGYPCVVAMCVDGPTVKPAPCSTSTFGHAELVGAIDDSTVTLWNPWSGGIDLLTPEAFLAAYGGGITVFEKSIKPVAVAPASSEEDDMATSDQHNVLVVGDDGGLWQWYFDEAAQKWVGARRLGTGRYLPQKPKVTGSGQRLDVYCTGLDRAVYHGHSNDAGVSWTDPTADDLGGLEAGDTIAAVGPGPAALVVTAPPDQAVLDALAEMKAHPAVILDPALAAAVTKIEKGLQAA